MPIVPVVAIGVRQPGPRCVSDAASGSRARYSSTGCCASRCSRSRSDPRTASTCSTFAGRIPLPSKITIRVLSPIDLRDRLGPDQDPEKAYRLVTTTMQQTLTALGRDRRFPVMDRRTTDAFVRRPRMRALRRRRYTR